MALVVEVGAQESDHISLDELLGLLEDRLTVVAGERVEVYLEQDAHIQHILNEVPLVEEEGVSFGVGQDGLVALYLEVEEDLFPVERQVYEGKLHQHVVGADGAELFFFAEQRSEIIVYHVFRGGAVQGGGTVGMLEGILETA